MIPKREIVPVPTFKKLANFIKLKIMKKLFLTLIVLICTSIIIISCSQDSKNELQEFTYTSGKLSLKEYLNSSNASSKNTNYSEDI